MNNWSAFLQKLKKTLSSLDSEGCDVPFFRGQSNSSWRLLPGIARHKWRNVRNNAEGDLYFDFVTQAGALLPENSSSWSNIFTMQHFGLPTRFLDWTETFSVALYFAIKNADADVAIWVLNPYRLNKITLNQEVIMAPNDLKHDYYTYFIAQTTKLEGDVVAMSPLRHNPRVFHQRSGFTLHDNIKEPLENLHPNVVTKLILKKTAFSDAYRFLELAGINEFTLFPDLEGLARELKRRYFL